MSLFFIYFAQERLYRNITTGNLTLGPEKYLRILSVIAVFVAVIISLFSARSKYKVSIYFAYSVLLFYITCSYIVSGANLLDMAQFMDGKGIGTWVCLGLIFVGYNDERFAQFNKFLIFSALFIACLALYNIFDFGIGYWRGQALSKYQVYATNYLWIAPYVFLILKNNQKLKWLRIFIILMGFILSLIIQTRSFIIIYILVLLFDFFNTRNKATYIALIVIGLAIMVFLIINTQVLGTSFELLMDRGTNDTRTKQLAVFTSQLNPIEMVTGKGFFASYRFGAEDWTAVDNQWLFLIWWGGLIPFAAYFYLAAVLPVKMMFRKGISYETKVECFVLILWVLALGGLAIFSSMTIEFFFFVISIILGRVLYKYSVNAN